jgi:membrane protease subunit (stomatin/prohibitin family)
MGIIRAAASAAGGALADQWLEVIEADNMGDSTVMTGGALVHRDSKRNQNKRGTEYLITDKSVIMVGQNQFMLLVDGGKVIDYSAEAGYYTVNNSSAPSLFNGNFNEALKETFNRIKFGGVPSVSQKVYFINTQEIKNIAFGTTNPVNYFDNFYNAELYLRAFGYFSIRIVDPLKFYAEAVPRNAANVNIEDIHKLYLAEFLNAFQTAINKMSADGIRISHVASKSMELAKYMADVLDDDWKERRGMVIESVGIANISYDEESKKLINIRNQGAMLSDPSVREGYVQGSIARGLEAAGSNEGGATQGFMGVGMGMQSGGNFMSSATATNQNQMNQQKAENEQKAASDPNSWTCSCGTENSGQFCSECGSKKPDTKFCPECGEKLPENAKFCTKCGKKL